MLSWENGCFVNSHLQFRAPNYKSFPISHCVFMAQTNGSPLRFLNLLRVFHAGSTNEHGPPEWRILRRGQPRANLYGSNLKTVSIRVWAFLAIQLRIFKIRLLSVSLVFSVRVSLLNSFQVLRKYGRKELGAMALSPRHSQRAFWLPSSTKFSFQPVLRFTKSLDASSRCCRWRP